MRDTDFTIEEIVRKMIQNKSPILRLKMGCSMYDTVKSLVIRSILENNPNISIQELRKEIFLIFYRDDFDSAQLGKILRYFEVYTTIP